MNSNDKAALAAMLGETAFALHEAKLFLDTHPNDCSAMEFFRRKQQKLCDLRQRYNAEIGPLTACAADVSQGQWRWVDEPWPWQL